MNRVAGTVLALAVIILGATAFELKVRLNDLEARVAKLEQQR